MNGNFAGGLAQGINNGLRLGKEIRDIAREQGLQEMREKAMAEATAESDKMVKDAVSEGPAESPEPAKAAEPAAPVATQPVEPVAPAPTESPDAASAKTAASAMEAPVVEKAPEVAQPTPQQAVAAGGVPDVAPKAAGRFTVKGLDGKTFETREEAMAAAQKIAPSAMDLFIKNSVPKIAGQYMVNGEVEKAEAWNKYAESHNGKRLIKSWADAFTAPDFDTAANKFGKFYTDHIDDGVDYTGHKMRVNADGTKVAIVTLKDKGTGKESEMELTREKMLALAGAANPQKLFENELARQTAAEKMKAEYALKGAQRKADLDDKKALERYKANINADKESNKINSKLDAQVEALRDAGYGDEEIKSMMPALLGATNHKKTTDPTERRALIASDLMKNDPRFSRMSPEDQNKRIDDTMKVIYGGEAKADKPAAGRVEVQDKPVPYDPKQKVVWNKKTGAPYHVIDGKYVPITGEVPRESAPAAAPAPAPEKPTPARAAATGLPEKPKEPEKAPEPKSREPSDYVKDLRKSSSERDEERRKQQAERDKAQAEFEAQQAENRRKIGDDFKRKYGG